LIIKKVNLGKSPVNPSLGFGISHKAGKSALPLKSPFSPFSMGEKKLHQNIPITLKNLNNLPLLESQQSGIFLFLNIPPTNLPRVLQWGAGEETGPCSAEEQTSIILPLLSSLLLSLP
jgi:hypothetical protein